MGGWGDGGVAVTYGGGDVDWHTDSGNNSQSETEQFSFLPRMHIQQADRFEFNWDCSASVFILVAVWAASVTMWNLKVCGDHVCSSPAVLGRLPLRHISRFRFPFWNVVNASRRKELVTRVIKNEDNHNWSFTRHYNQYIFFLFHLIWLNDWYDCFVFTI